MTSDAISLSVAERGAADLAALAWPAEHLADALEALARQSGLVRATGDAPAAAPAGVDLERWVDAVAGGLGLEAEPVRCGFGETAELVRNGGPALLRLPPDAGGAQNILALVRCNGRAVLLTPERTLAYVAPERLSAALSAGLTAPLHGQVERLLQQAGVPEARRASAGRALLNEQLAGVTIAAGWLLRQRLDAPFAAYARHLNLGRPLLFVGVLTLTVQSLSIVTWALLGREALGGVFTWAQISAWGLLLLSAVPVQLWLTLAQRRLELLLSVIIKQRLLAGTFALQPDAVRHQGAGAFLGLVIDAETFDEVAATGGLTVLNAVVQLISAALIFSVGGAGLHAALLGFWALLALGLIALVVRLNGRWFRTHRAMTNDLVEHMVGHRTRLVQEERSRWHEAEDRALAQYLRVSAGLDWSNAILTTLPRTWSIAALLGLAPSIVNGGDPTMLAISLGGIVLAQQGLSGLANSGAGIATSFTAWRQIAPLLRTPAAPGAAAALPPAPPSAPRPGQPLITARGLVYRYRPGGEPALRGANLQIAVGDRILLEGASGGGKSTLAAVIAGLRRPEAGLLLLNGLDQPSLGASGWRRSVAMAPQFHENHIFTGTFAYNLLMGRRWPPEPDDLAEAEDVCRELGLGDLLERMPAGMQQQVGETGWQLSHGERSRLFLARALLQGAPLIILDESFGALDPETLELALDCALRRAPAMLIIAHP